ncbi:unnamed protein product [Phaedon cochleariae]|uniref:ZP domain-containing protein n=1 Tax=Phaedon cochleariae TaxID=80249 RepID=A0A9N9S8W2_PHACE|nr:unnamed protein product [Phaedon cochleariae]
MGVDYFMRWRYALLLGILISFVPNICLCETLEDTTSAVEYSVSISSSTSVGRDKQIEAEDDSHSSETAAILDIANHSREALTQEANSPESVVFIGDTSDYVPGTSLRARNQDDPEVGIDWEHPLDTWDREYRRIRFNNTRVQREKQPYQIHKINYIFSDIEAECQDDYMKIRVGFNGSFTGLVYSAGYAYDPDCMYINGTGRDYYEFFIQLNRCGTLGKNTHTEENKKTPTYNPLIEEEFDEHFKVTCEYGYDFWKTVTFPFLDVEVATGNPVVFTLTPPECYMEIRYGYGTAGNRVTGPVRVGDPLTLIIYMRSKYDGFDIVVNDCYAHNGATKKIQLIDEYGCPVDDKLISRFRGSWTDAGVFETQVFAYMKTFRFTGSPALYIECYQMDPHSVCMKTGWFSALLALGGGAMCLLGGALLATCSRMKKVSIDKVLASTQFNGYMNHRGSIN